MLFSYKNMKYLYMFELNHRIKDPTCFFNMFQTPHVLIISTLTKRKCF